jgi:hypothetical protein
MMMEKEKENGGTSDNRSYDTVCREDTTSLTFFVPLLR